MGQEMQNPDALAGAAGVPKQAVHFATPEYQERAEHATTLHSLLCKMHSEDAISIVLSYLAHHQSLEPVFTDFWNTRADAEWWADCAHPKVLVEYFIVSLNRLGRTDLGINDRKRLLVVLWQTMNQSDRANFLSRLDPKGSFIWRGVR